MQTNIIQSTFGEDQPELKLPFAMCTVFCAGSTVTYYSVDVVGLMGPAQLCYHSAVYAMFARVASHEGIVAEVKENGAYGGG